MLMNSRTPVLGKFPAQPAFRVQYELFRQGKLEESEHDVPYLHRLRGLTIAGRLNGTSLQESRCPVRKIAGFLIRAVSRREPPRRAGVWE